MVFFVLSFIIYNLSFITPVHAIVDPLSVTNNKFGIHIIGATDQEASNAATLVNSSGGDWGYVTVVVQDSDRNHDKWQTFFNTLREKHLIPIVRLATAPDGDYWKLPYDGEEQAWADFLDSLNWPTKNRYVIIYNEPNQAQEWGNKVDAATYAQVLSKTIGALKNKNPDFFVLNAGFDASAPEKPPAYEDEEQYLKEMNQAVPGIFNKLDGWVSHSYPNPGYVGSPDGTGRASVRNYQWEESVLKGLGLNKELPIFITETGWKHAEGEVYDKSLPSSDEVGTDLKEAFAGAWNDSQIVAVTPFLMDYQGAPFDHFSFKRLDSDTQDLKILGAKYPSDPNADYYPQYLSYQSIAKKAGTPVQDNLGQLQGHGIYNSIVADQTYNIPLTFKNTGQAIWGDNGPIRLIPTLGQNDLQILIEPIPPDLKVAPGQTVTFHLSMHAPSSGQYKVELTLFDGSKEVNVSNMDFTTEVKAPVVLVVKSSLQWKNDSAGDYLLSIISSIGENTRDIILGTNGSSAEIQANELLPDYDFDFTLSKPFYQPKTIHTTVHSGVNTLDFGQLQPDIGSAILNPVALWHLLPFSH